MMSILYFGKPRYEQCYNFQIIDKDTNESQKGCFSSSNFKFPSRKYFPNVDYSMIPGSKKFALFSDIYEYDPRNLNEFECNGKKFKFLGSSYKSLSEVIQLRNSPKYASDVHEYFAYSLLCNL